MGRPAVAVDVCAAEPCGVVLSLCLGLYLGGMTAWAPFPAVPIGGAAGDVVVRDEQGLPRRLAGWEPARVLVVAFVAAECPLAELYGERLARLSAGFGPRGVAFLGLASPPRVGDGDAGCEQFRELHRLGFPVLEDQDGALAARLGAARTPSVVVLDAARRVRYRGRIDDQYTRSARLPEPRNRELADALDALLAGRPIARAETEAIGCPIDRPATGTEPAGSSPPPLPPLTYTYTRDVAPLLRQRCVPCHRPGQIAPFSLSTYRQASGWAEAIAEAVQERRMPPWQADPAHGTFANDMHLSDREIVILTRWVAAGCVQGEDPPVSAAAAAGPGSGSGLAEGSLGEWSIPGPDRVVAIPRPFLVPAEGVLDYQQFEVDPGFREDRWIAAAEILPGSRAVVHHCTVYLQPPGASEPAYSPGELGSFCLVATAAGTAPMTLPPGMAKRIPAGWRLVFVLHYAPNGKAQWDQTRLGLTFARPKAVRQEVSTRLLHDANLCIPPHAPDHRVEQSWQVGDDLLLLALFPHMHLRGKSFRYEADYPDGTRETLLSVPRYDFNWQHRYVLARPKRIPAGTTLRCVAHYDNSAANPANPDPGATVHTGKQSTDEMFNGYFDVALADQDLTRPVLPSEVLLRRARARLDRTPGGLLSAAVLVLAVCQLALGGSPFGKRAGTGPGYR